MNNINIHIVLGVCGTNKFTVKLGAFGILAARGRRIHFAPFGEIKVRGCQISFVFGFLRARSQRTSTKRNQRDRQHARRRAAATTRKHLHEAKSPAQLSTATELKPNASIVIKALSVSSVVDSGY